MWEMDFVQLIDVRPPTFIFVCILARKNSISICHNFFGFLLTWDWTRARFPITILVASPLLKVRDLIELFQRTLLHETYLSSLPRFAAVESLDARVISRFPCNSVLFPCNICIFLLFFQFWFLSIFLPITTNATVHKWFALATMQKHN